MKKLYLTISICIVALMGIAQNNSITNIQVEQRPDGSGLVDVYFTLNGEGTNYYIVMEVSFDAGTTYSTIHSTYTTGDVGPINPGSGKHIVWDGLNSHSHTFSEQARLKITAISGTFPDSGVPCPGMPTVTYEGKTYNTVQIGNQCWLKENLNVGLMIHSSVNQTDNGVAGNPMIEKYCYNDDEIYCEIYGGLYQWNEAVQYITTITGPQGICPPGWHIPTDAEWKELEGYVDSQYGIDNPVWDQTGWRGFDAGKKLKSSSGWSNTNGTDHHGYSVLPGGRLIKTHLSSQRGYTMLNTGSVFWTSDHTNLSSGYVWFRIIEGNETVYRSDRAMVTNYPTSNYSVVNNAAYVRCIRD